MSKVGYFWQQSWLLIVSAFCFGLLMAVTNASLSPRIEQNKAAKLNALMTTLLPQAKSFEAADPGMEIELGPGKKEPIQVYKALSETRDCVGWSFKISGAGFADKIEMVVAVDKDFKALAGFSVLTCSETPGFGDRMKGDEFRNQFVGAPATVLRLAKGGDRALIDEEIVAITGATVTSEAVVATFNRYLEKIRQQVAAKGWISHGG